MEIPELVRSVCPTSNLRLSRLDGVHRKTTDNFDKLFRALGVRYKSNLHLSEESAVSPFNCISAVGVIRGQGCLKYGYEHVKSRLGFLKFVSWNPYPVDVWYNQASLGEFNRSGVKLV